MDGPLSDGVAARLAGVHERVERACERSGRAAASVRVVAVSKRQPVAAIREAYAAGQRDFGENYTQELLAKCDELADLAGIRWHHIGHLQRNKVKQLAGRTTLLHGVDSARLLEEIGKRSSGVTDVLLQVNVSGEPSKSGCQPTELVELLAAVPPEVMVRGLMTMPPDVDDPEDARRYFRALRQLRDRHGAALSELSMGMSHDFEVAIEEGATIVRVGTAIFGPRG